MANDYSFQSDPLKNDLPPLQVFVVDLNSGDALERGLDRLFKSIEDGVVGLDCEVGEKSIRLIQLATRSFAIIIRVPEKKVHLRPGKLEKLESLLTNGAIYKSGAELQSDVLDIWRSLRIPVNGCLNISMKYMRDGARHPDSLINIMKKQYPDMSMTYKKKEITLSNWDSKDLTQEQIEYAARDAQCSFLIGVTLSPKEREALAVSMSFKTPRELDMISEWRECEHFSQREQLHKEQKVSFENVKFKAVEFGVEAIIESSHYSERIRSESIVELQLRNGTTLTSEKCRPNGRTSSVFFRCDDSFKNISRYDIVEMIIKRGREKAPHHDIFTRFVREWFTPAFKKQSFLITTLLGEDIPTSSSTLVKKSFLNEPKIKTDSKEEKKIPEEQKFPEEKKNLFTTTCFGNCKFILQGRKKNYLSPSILDCKIGEEPQQNGLHSHSHDLLFEIKQPGVGVGIGLTEPEVKEEMKLPVTMLERTTSEDFRIFRRDLNPSQEEAIRIAFESRVTLIQGPPGTGKTETSAALLEEAVTRFPNTKFLVTAQTNAATRQIAMALAQRLGPKLVGLHVAREFLYDWHDDEYKCLKQKGFLVEKSDPPRAITVCTLTYSLVSKRARFFEECSWLIMDEASQIWDMMATLMFRVLPKVEKLTMFGDSKQLPPFMSHSLHSREESKKKDVKSVLDRFSDPLRTIEIFSNFLISTNSTVCSIVLSYADLYVPQNWLTNPKERPQETMLRIQYRMRKHNGTMISKVFYDGKLRSHDTSDEVAVEMIEVLGECRTEGTSKYNEQEIDAIAGILPRCETEEIVILTGHEAQRKRLQERFKSLPNARVSTVDSFQGQEADYVILSLVVGYVNSPDAFICHMRRANVACSRAKKRLFIVCHPDLKNFTNPANPWHKIASFLNTDEHDITGRQIEMGNRRKRSVCHVDSIPQWRCYCGAWTLITVLQCRLCHSRMPKRLVNEDTLFTPAQFPALSTSTDSSPPSTPLTPLTTSSNRTPSPLMLPEEKKNNKKGRTLSISTVSTCSLDRDVKMNAGINPSSNSQPPLAVQTQPKSKKEKKTAGETKKATGEPKKVNRIFLCRYYMEKGFCHNNTCGFAHGGDSLESATGIHYKSRLCEYKKRYNKECPNLQYKVDCWFAHSEAELKKPKTRGPNPAMEKTELCKHWNSPDGCRLSSSECKFAHGEKELKRHKFSGSKKQKSTKSNTKASGSKKNNKKAST